MSLNYKKISEFFGVGVGVEKKFFSESELESELKKKFFRSRSRVSESKSVTPLITRCYVTINKIFIQCLDFLYGSFGKGLYFHSTVKNFEKVN
jgi:hypothetical protein